LLKLVLMRKASPKNQFVHLVPRRQQLELLEMQCQQMMRR
jgi:hypothetical protein